MGGVSGVFPVGTTTVNCNGYGVGGINANRDGNEYPTFDVTVVLGEADDTPPPADTSNFTTVKTDLGGGHVCIGYENAPAGATNVRLIWNEIGQNASSLNDYPVGNGISVAIDDSDASCLFNSSQDTCPFCGDSTTIGGWTANNGGYWWVEAFDDPSSYTVMGYGQTPSGSYADYEGTSTQIFLEAVLLLTTPDLATCIRID